MKTMAAVVGGLMVATGLGAQEGAAPEGWQMRADRPGVDLSEVQVTEMEPGFHVTTGPAVILYHPDSTATGSFRAEAETFLFDPGRRREAFGLIVGGSELQGDDQSYLYFLIRNGGEFIVKRREGASAPTIQGWTAHPAIVSWAGSGDDTARNVLAIDAGDETVRFFVNDQEVWSMPRGSQSLDGIVGLRVNHGLNLHVSSLDIQR